MSKAFPADRPGCGALRLPAVRPAVVRHSDVEIVPGPPARPSPRTAHALSPIGPWPGYVVEVIQRVYSRSQIAQPHPGDLRLKSQPETADNL